MKTIQIPKILQNMHSFFKKKGFTTFLVGGAVRDILRGKEASDWDLATDATPHQVMSLFSRVIPTGIDHGTVTVHFMDKEIEVTTFRTEDTYTDGRHPDSVQYATTIEDDLSRRDFTMNAIAADLESGKIIDPFAGIKDIKKHTIRTVGNPIDRFTEDGLRPIRAIRFSSQLGFTIDKQTLNAIDSVLDSTKKVSIERFRDEFIKIIMSPKPSIGLQLMEKTGILELFIPELVLCRNVKQADERGHHIFDVLDHLYASCNGSSFYNFNVEVRLASLFHDVGKPLVKKEDMKNLDPKYPEKQSPIITFYNHEKTSAQLTQTILERLKLPKKTISTITHLITHHMFHYESSWSDAAVRRFVVRVGIDFIENLFNLRYCDVYGMEGKPVIIHNSIWGENIIEFKDRIQKIIGEKTALSLKDLAINGKDIMNLGIPSGKHIGLILNELFTMVVDNPEQNSKDHLLTIANNLWEKRYS